MANQISTSSQYTVLFTSQKLKKHKTWQDGTITYYNLNKKIVLTDEKGYNIDRKFSKTGAPDVGDEIEFDMHIVTVESIHMEIAVCHRQQQQEATLDLDTTAQSTAQPSLPPNTSARALCRSNSNTASVLENNYRLARRRLQRHNNGARAPNLSQPRLKPRSTTATVDPPLVEISSVDQEHGTTERDTNSRSAVQLHSTTTPQHDTTTPDQQLFGNLQLGHRQLSNNGTPQDDKKLSAVPSQKISRLAPIRKHLPLDAEYQHQDLTDATEMATKAPANSRMLLPTLAKPSTSDNDISTPTRMVASSTRTGTPSFNGNTTMQMRSPARPHSTTPMEQPRLANTPVPNRNEGIDISASNPSADEDSTKRRTGGDTNAAAPKRIRVGLSKRTGQLISHIGAVTNSMPPNNSNNNNNNNNEHSTPTGHQSTSLRGSNYGQLPLSNSPTTAAATFIRASQVAIDGDSQSVISGGAVPSTSTSSQASKRFKVPYADGISVPLVLQFPTMERAMDVIKTKRLPKRTKVTPTQFANITRYKDIFKRMIHEHLQIMLLNNALHFYANLPTANPSALERHFRSKGLSFYQNCQLRSNNRSMSGSCFYLAVKNRESSHKYGKDDIWVISSVLAFDASATFLARSTFFGPSSNGSLDIECLTPRDTRVASNMALGNSNVFALRTVSASAEYMMLDCLEMPLDRLPILPSILKPRKKNKLPEPLHHPKSAVIQLTSYDNIDVQAKLDETIRQYNLNNDQESVLRSVAKSVIISPGWNEDAEEHITLVHGVFGSGKSFLAAVLIIFIRDIVDAANRHREPEDQINFRIMISCFTNVAVDRILTILVKLGYDEFIRIGSLKKISKNLLPYTIKAKLSGNEELKELEHMLEDPQNSEEDTDNIANALQRFRRCENILELQKADVVGTTCNASSFEIFSESHFPFILMDECSQVMEPLSLVPLLRFKCSKMVMIGDPKQLPPTVATQADENNHGLGLEKSLFSRLIEMGTQTIMLRTQYRCHPSISGISNNLFYDGRLLNGSNVEMRPPLLNGFPPLLFVDVLGNEQRSIGNSYWNQDEIVTIGRILQGLSELGAHSSDIGIISLYKEQADKIQSYMGNNNGKSSHNIQISTVDAFQGAEKEIIILSTVRTSSSGFIDNHPRVNVALTRAKRHLIILGSRNLLVNNEIWGSIISQCKGNNVTMHQIASFLTSLRPQDSG